jgi:hypothetical protein
MKYKLFPVTTTRDQFMMEFDTAEERQAFEEAIEHLKPRAMEMKAHESEDTVVTCRVGTKLHLQMLEAYQEEAKEILGVHVFNPISKDQIVMVIYPVRRHHEDS